ncbi:unnamed protein product [Chrysodeixis includens]|uniref:Uncharacterized protein n=1 Tax=Chrysodeixis includens TaxID=689277 RepID=A0A9N8PYR6_CHRIL|nr:unnamed protein product [Chrysodeixis includens]
MVSGIRHPAVARRVAYESGTRDEPPRPRAPPARSRRPPLDCHHYTCAPRAFRAPPFAVATPRHFLAHVGDAAGRARTPGSNAINATVVNERRPRPGGLRPLIGRAADDDRGAHGGGVCTPSPLRLWLSRGCGVLRATTQSACETCVHLSVDVRDPSE